VFEAFVPACVLIVVAVRVLNIDAATGEYSEFFWNGRDRKVVGSNRSILRFGVVFCMIDALRNEVLFLGGIEGVFMLPSQSICQQVFLSSRMLNDQFELWHESLPTS